MLSEVRLLSRSAVRWAAAGRVPFTSVSVIPVLFTAVWANWAGVSTSAGLSVLMTAGTFFLSLGANTINDYADWNRSDGYNPWAGPFNGGSRSSMSAVFSRRSFLSMSVWYYILAGIITAVITFSGRPWTPLFACIGAAAGILYSLPPFALHSRGMGEMTVFMAFGPLLTLSAGYVCTGRADMVFFLIGIPNGLLTALILWVNQFPDYTADSRARKNNLLVRFGPSRARIGAVLIEVLFYSSIVIFTSAGVLPYASVLILACVPWSMNITRELWKRYDNPAALQSVQRQAVLSHAVRMGGLTAVLSVPGIF